ncbi:hypothetical protein CQA53_12000, partial [Helicobacter didelphidarum]
EVVKKFSKNPPYDEFGMLPFLDELIGVDWVMDFNMLYQYAVDDGYATRVLYEEISKGKLKDPRDTDSTKESKKEFYERSESVLGSYLESYNYDIPNDWSEQIAKTYIDKLLLIAKVMAVTPPQGYPNAPTYYIPEYLEELYREGKFDIKLDP